MATTDQQRLEPHSWARSPAMSQVLKDVDHGLYRDWPAAQIVVDAGATMPMWWPMLPDLYRMAAQAGGFEGFNVSVLSSDGVLRGRWAADGAITLVVSDCMGPQWRPGPAGERWFRTLHACARQQLVSIVQPLPERMWRRTALRGAAGVMHSPAMSSANSALRFTPYDRPGADAMDGLPMPVVEACPQWLENWSALVNGPAAAEVPVYVLHVPTAPALHQGQQSNHMSAEELVLNSRATASPEAFRLAGHLAVGITELPVMRRVQAAVEPQPDPIHLAEVITSGMLRALPGAPGRYVFREGVCELLLHTLTRTAFARTASALIKAGTELAAGPGVTVALDPSLALLSSAGLDRLHTRGPAGGIGPPLLNWPWPAASWEP
ncbi:SAV_2336 N-terminal domain-related protein [Streptomyces massasporeus]|uniref:SAV_2336 N-terminal domain-related protein n=1 Tax=Streptomyces massasporeus TaxID=67324 RepID=UPI0036862685